VVLKNGVLDIIVDQKEVFAKNWTQKTVIKNAYNALFANFVRILSLQNDSGEIIQEASTSLQDITIYERFYNLQAGGLLIDSINSEEVKNRLTTLSFVTKKHMDTESQLADLLSYGLRLEYCVNHKLITVASLNNYQLMIRKRAKSKLYKIQSNVPLNKKTKCKHLQPLTILP